MNSFLETIKQLGAARLAIMGGVLVSLLVFFVFVSMHVTTPGMKLLYSELSTIDSSSIAAKLEELRIPYEISADGTQVMVAGREVGRARMTLAEAGLPNGGNIGYEIFDEKSGFGSTNFEQNINQVRALEGELARTVRSLDAIRSARVHLVLPQRELFSREERKSSASVFINVRPGMILEAPQILAIQSLVSSAVPQLTTSSVSVIDQNGKLLANADGDDQETLISSKAEDMRRSYEKRLTQKIEEMISSIVGYGKVRVNVTADLDFNRISTNEELFDPATQVVRSSQVTEENNTERDQPNDNVSAENNLPGVTDDLFLEPAPSLQSNRIEEVTNFEISKTIRNSIREVGEVQKLSVAVLVDGTYTTTEEGVRNYAPRTEEELDQIAALVRSAIGFDTDRGDTLEVVNMQFAEVKTTDDSFFIDSLFGFERSDLVSLAEVVIIAVLVILVILLILQPMVSRLLAVEESQREDDEEPDLLSAVATNPALTGPDGSTGANASSPDDEEDDDESLIDMNQVQGKVKASSIKKVEGIVDNYPAETVSVLRGWMSQET